MGVLLERRHRRHDSRLADAAARRRSARRGVRRLRAAAGARPALVLAERHRLSGLRPHDEHDVPGAGRADPGLHPRADAGVEDALRRRRDDDARGDGLRRQRTGRIEGGEHRHQPAGHRRSAELSDLHRRRARHDAARHLRRARGGVSAARRRLRRRRRRTRRNRPDRRSRTDVDLLRDALHRVWGFSDFRPLQREAMHAVLDGRDSVVVLPTGGGKSLCFQAPALVDARLAAPAAARPRPPAGRASRLRAGRLAAHLADEGSGRRPARGRRRGGVS